MHTTEGIEKSKLRVRWLVLVLLSLLMSGNYYCYDNPAALYTPLARRFVPNRQFELYFDGFYSVYSLPNIVLPLPLSPHISSYLPISPHISHISPYLPISEAATTGEGTIATIKGGSATCAAAPVAASAARVLLAAGLSELSIATPTRGTGLQPEMGQWSEPTCMANRQPHAARAQTRARSALRSRRRTTRRAGRLPVKASVGARRVARTCALRVGLLRYVSCGSAGPGFSSLYIALWSTRVDRR